jgi:hypothetical protein
VAALIYDTPVLAQAQVRSPAIMPNMLLRLTACLLRASLRSALAAQTAAGEQRVRKSKPLLEP